MWSFHCVGCVISEWQVRNAPNSILPIEYQSIKKSLPATSQQCEEIFFSIVLCFHIPISSYFGFFFWSSMSSTILLHYVPFSYSHHLFSVHLHSTCHLILHAPPRTCYFASDLFCHHSFWVFYFCFSYALRGEKLVFLGCGSVWISSWQHTFEHNSRSRGASFLSCDRDCEHCRSRRRNFTPKHLTAALLKVIHLLDYFSGVIRLKVMQEVICARKVKDQREWNYSIIEKTILPQCLQS